MKRLFSAFLSLLILLSVSVSASSQSSFPGVLQKASPVNTGSAKDATQRRNVFEYMELAINRMTLFAEHSSYDSRECLNPLTGILPQDDSGEYTVMSSVGLLKVSNADNAINTALILCRNVNDDSETVTNSVYSFVGALSALEFDDMEDRFIGLKYKVGLSESKDAVEEASRIWLEVIFPNIQKTLNTETKKNKQILVYSGNYDYYLEYTDYKDSLLISITAQVR